MRLTTMIAMATLALGAVMGGCVRYHTPGRAADFNAMGITDAHQDAMTDPGVREAMLDRPAASFPARVAIARVQDRGYRSHTSYGYGTGRYSLVGVREVERDEDMERLVSMPMVGDAVMLNRLVVPDTLDSLEDIRAAAGRVHADMLLLYTFDTKFWSEATVPVVGVLTLGIFPNKQAKVTSTTSAALVDVRSGYVYGLVEGTAMADQLANAWTTRSAIDQSRQRAEREAFERATDQFAGLWKGVVERHAVHPDRRPAPQAEEASAGVFGGG